MDKFAPNSSDVSHSDNVAKARFTSHAATAEDLLKAQTVGLVNLNDYRKRRAEALDLKERGGTPQVHSGTSTPQEEYVRHLCDCECTLICKVQSIYTQATFQEEAQSSR
jgi:hypothetical protein